MPFDPETSAQRMRALADLSRDRWDAHLAMWRNHRKAMNGEYPEVPAAATPRALSADDQGGLDAEATAGTSVKVKRPMPERIDCPRCGRNVGARRSGYEFIFALHNRRARNDSRCSASFSPWPT